MIRLNHRFQAGGLGQVRRPLMTIPGMVPPVVMPQLPQPVPPKEGMSPALKWGLAAAAGLGIAYAIHRSRQGAAKASAPAPSPATPSANGRQPSRRLTKATAERYGGGGQLTVAFTGASPADAEAMADALRSEGLDAQAIDAEIVVRSPAGHLANVLERNPDLGRYLASERRRRGSRRQRRRKPWSRLPAGWTKASLEDFWDSVGGRVRTCIKKIGDRVDDPGAFCASIADRIEGPAWRSREAARSSKSFQVGDVVKYSREFLRSTMSEDRQGVVQSIYDMPASPFKHWPRVLWEDETEPKLVAPSNLVLKSRIHLELP